MAEIIHGDARANQLNVTSDKTQAYGLAGNDTLTSDGKSNVLLVGGSGDDSLIMTGGNGTLSGGKGKDTFELTYSATKKLSAVIDDLVPSEDKIIVNFDGLTAPQLTSVTSGNDLVLRDSAGNFNVTLKSVRDNDYLNSDVANESWEVLHFTNNVRDSLNLPLLAASEGLTNAAQIRAQEITELGTNGNLDVYKHMRPDGTDFSTVLDGKYSSFGENLDGGAKSPAAVMDDWIGSASHYANIVNPNFFKLGIGYNENDTDPTDKRFYWTQLFADSLNNPETVNVSSASPQVNTVSKFVTLTENPDTYSNSEYGATIAALGGGDRITNTSLIVSISGGNDNDTIDNRGSFATINGGAGNDSINLNAAQEVLIQYTGGNDSISGFNETSTLSISSSDYTLPEIVGNNIVVAVGDDSITLVNAAGLKSIHILPATVQTESTTPGGLNINNIVNNVQINGTAYADTIENRGLHVSIDGGAGEDSIHNDGNYVYVDGGNDNDRISNGFGNNSTLYGGDGDDYIYNNTLTSDMLINGGDGHDSIWNEGGNTTIDGGDGRDTIYNYGEEVIIYGRRGYENIYNYGSHVTIDSGPTGSDIIANSGGNNVSILGSEHNNTIRSSGNNVTINALADDDRITVSGSFVTVDGGEGNDRIESSSVSSNLLLNGGNGNDKISNFGDSVTIDAGDGNDNVFNGNFKDNNIGNVIIDLGAGNDTASNYASNVTITGGAGDDSIDNNSDSDSVSIDAGAGNNYISNFQGNSVTITGGDGSDTIDNRLSRSVTIKSGAGNDSIYNSSNTVSIDAGDGNDTIENSSLGYRVTINAGKGNDSMKNGGDSQYFSNYGVRYEYASGDGFDTITGFDATSTLNISGGEYSTSISGNDIVVKVGDGSILLQGAASLTAINIEGTKSSVSTGLIMLTSGNDTYSNTVDAVTIMALSGDDSIDNTGANVSIDGGTDDDTITNAGNSVTITADAGNDSIDNTGDNVSIDGGAWGDWIASNGANVTINGGAGSDSISLDSAAQGNLIQYNSGDGYDDVYGFDANDTLQIGDGSGTYTSQTGGFGGYDLIVKVGTGLISLVEAASLSVNIAGTPGASIGEDGILRLTEGDDIYGNDVDGVTIQALGGNDSIRNTYDADNVSIDAGTGNDSVYNSGDNSTVDGGAGNDTVWNFGDNLSIFGGDANDSIDNSGDTVTIDAGDGDDTVQNWDDNVTILGGDGYDSIYNIGATVSIDAGDGNDSIESSGANVTLSGGGGIDRITLTNSAANNVIEYNSGDGYCYVYGFNTDDTLKIGDGSDTYATTKSGNDIIVNVGTGEIILYGAATLSTVNIEGKFNDYYNITLTEGNDSYNDSLNGVTIRALGGDDTVWNDGQNVSIDGGTGDDHIWNAYASFYSLGSVASNTTVNGGAGNDSIYNAWGVRVTLGGDDGNDFITNVAASVSIDGGAGNDIITNYNNTVTITAGAGNDSVYNHDGNSVSINSGAGDDSITNTAASVSIDAGAGDDLISLGSNAYSNLITYAEGGGNDTIQGFDSSSTLKISGDSYVRSTVGSDILISVGTGSILLTNAARYTRNNLHIVSDNPGKWLSNHANNTTVEGTDKNDTILSDGTNVLINALGGYDSVNNSGSNVTIDGGANNDTILNYGSEISVAGGAGDDFILNDETGSTVTIDAGDGSDTVSNLGNDVTIAGGAGKDSLWNVGSNISISAGDGNDYIESDTYHIGYLDGTGGRIVRPENISVDAGAGDDTVSNQSTSMIIDLGVGNDTSWNYSNKVTLNGGDGDDFIQGFGANSSLLGGDGNDTFDGGGDTTNATIIGGKGNDLISLSSESQYQYVQYTAGDGNDTIWGLSPNSSINFLNVLKGDFDSIGSGNDIILIVGDGSITLKDVRENPPHVIIGESGTSGGGSDSGGDGGNGGGSSSGNDSGGRGGNDGGNTSGGTSASEGRNSDASGGRSASGSSGNQTSTNTSGGTVRVTTSRGGGSRIAVATNISDFMSALTPATQQTTAQPTANQRTYSGGNQIISDYTSGEKIIFNAAYTGSFYDNAGNYCVGSSTGALVIQNAVDKVIELSDAAGNSVIKAYAASSAGIIDGRGLSGFEVINGSAGADSIFAGDGGSQLWGGADYVQDIMVGGNGTDIFIGGRTQGADLFLNASSADIIHLNDATLSDIVATEENNGAIAIAFNTGNAVAVQSTEAMSAAFMLADGSAYRYNHSTKNWQTA